jgi:crotonobetainyl-CoA:carnitine CoA-transferase CaiB-like acyl-CoA transferase
VDNSKPLAGIRVLDFTHVLSGPYGTQLLADAGADVVKIEPFGGETSRIRGLTRTGSDGRSLSVYYAAVDAGKRSVVLDLKSEAGRSTALRMARRADVIIENFSAGVLTRLGLDLDRLRADNPRLITMSIRLEKAPEQPGSLQLSRGLSIVAEAESGLLRSRQERAEDRPRQLGFVLGDLVTGMTAYAAVVTSLVGRERHGVGAHHEIGMVESLVPLNSLDLVTAQFSETDTSPRQPAGYGIFRTRDGWVTIGVNNDELWRRLANAMGQPDLAQDATYGRYDTRDDHRDELNELVEAWSSARTTAEVLRLLDDGGVPCGTARNAREQLADSSRDYLFDTLDDGQGGTVRIPRNSLGYARENATYSQAGADTEVVLSEWLG